MASSLEEYIGWLTDSSQGCLRDDATGLLLSAVLDQVYGVKRDYAVQLNSIRIIVPSIYALSIWANIIHVYCFDDYMLDSISDPNVKTVVDAGAFIGLVSLRLASRYPDARIIAVEPNPGILGYLKLNIEVNGLSNRIIVEEAALADRSGQGVLFVPRDSPVNASLSREYASRYGGENLDVVSVRMKTLSDLVDEYKLDRIDILKLDIEGEESNVIQHIIASSILDRIRIGNIIIEAHGEDESITLASLLRSRGYSCDSRRLSGTYQWIIKCLWARG